MYRHLLLGRARLRPWEVRQLTLAELALALDDDLEQRRPPHGGASLSGPDVAAHVAWLRSATVRQRIARLRQECS